MDGPPLPDAEAKNAAYRDSLSAEAQREYDIALVGHYDDASADDPNPSACRTLAMAAHPEPASIASQTVQELLWSADYIADEALSVTSLEASGAGFKRSIGNDPRLASLKQEYTECVRANKQGSWYSDEVTDPASMMGIAWGTAADGSVFDPQGATEVSILDIPPEYRGLQANTAQIDIALTDFQCRADTDYVNRYADIQFDAEQAYIDEFRPQLEQLLADIEDAIDRLG